MTRSRVQDRVRAVDVLSPSFPSWAGKPSPEGNVADPADAIVSMPPRTRGPTSAIEAAGFSRSCTACTGPDGAP